MLKIAPPGWHVPTDAEWDTLENHLISSGYNWDGTTTNNKIGKSLAARADWKQVTDSGFVGSNLAANNRTGFSGYGAGARIPDDSFQSLDQYGTWWSATEFDSKNACYRFLGFDLDHLYRGDSGNVKNCGFSVRLVKD